MHYGVLHSRRVYYTVPNAGHGDWKKESKNRQTTPLRQHQHHVWGLADWEGVPADSHAARQSGYADCWMFPSINKKQIRKGYLYINTEANYRKLRHLHVRVQACKYLHVSPHAVDSVRLRLDYQS